MDAQPAYSHWAARIGYGLAGFLMLYVLGIGPAGYIHQRSPRMRNTLNVVYAPLLALRDTPLATPIGIYVGWWEDLARKHDKAPEGRVPGT
jgi:hypothetical protein